MAAKQPLLEADNVTNTYNYPNLVTTICKHAPVFVVKVSRSYFFNESAGHAQKVWSGDETGWLSERIVMIKLLQRLFLLHLTIYPNREPT